MPPSAPLWEKAMALLNPVELFTLAWLAFELRKPLVAFTSVDPTDEDHIFELRTRFLRELHNFFGRVWKLVATIAITRITALLVTHMPSASRAAEIGRQAAGILLALPLY
eukprot:SM000091S24588  [mRNA]  locus=s91:221025:221601:+ [translate_table: standard]